MPTRPRLRLALSLLVLTTGCSTLKPSRDGNPATGSVQGRVVDAAGKGIPNAIVSVLTPDTPPRELASATSNYNGDFTVERIPPGDDRVVRATKIGRAVTTRGTRERVNVTGGRTRDVGTIELKALGA
jgi:hypothetical protein